MARLFKWSENKIAQLIREGRGKGTGPTYSPWVQIADFSSRGDSRRVFSRKTGRVHHLMSTVEWWLFLLLEFSEDVIDIREQYPLSRDDTGQIAVEFGVTHPRYPGTNVLTVMTVDFFVVRQLHGVRYVELYDCKRTDDAEDVRTLEKLEITRRFAEGVGIPHHLVFSSALPKNRVRNLEWIRTADACQEESEEDVDYYTQHQARLLNNLANYQRTCSLAQYCEHYDSLVGAIPGTGLRIVRQLLLSRQLTTDLNQPDLASSPIAMFKARNDNRPRLAVGG